MATTPRQRMLGWVREHRGLDMTELRVEAVNAFQADREMVEFALGQVAVWERYNLGSLIRESEARRAITALREGIATGDVVASFLDRFPATITGRVETYMTMTWDQLAEWLDRRERELDGEVRMFNFARDVYTFRPARFTLGRTTVGEFFAESDKRMAKFAALVQTHFDIQEEHDERNAA